MTAPHLFRASVLLALLTLSVGCEHVRVAPDPVAFGQVWVGAEGRVELNMKNEGSFSHTVKLEPRADAVTLEHVRIALSAGETTRTAANFTPQRAGELQEVVAVRGTDIFVKPVDLKVTGSAIVKSKIGGVDVQSEELSKGLPVLFDSTSGNGARRIGLVNETPNDLTLVVSSSQDGIEITSFAGGPKLLAVFVPAHQITYVIVRTTQALEKGKSGVVSLIDKTRKAGAGFAFTYEK